MRRHRAPKRKLSVDPKYNSPIIGHFINILMLNGKKSMTERIVYDSFEIVKDKTKEDPLKVFYAALDNARPRVKVKPRRIGGATYQVPVTVPGKRQISLAIRWILQVTRKKKGKPRRKNKSQQKGATAN